MAVFQSPKVRDEVFENGLWKFQNSPIYMQKWIPNFNVENHEPYDFIV